MTTDIVATTNVVKVDAEDERSQTRGVADNLGKLLARIDEVMRSKKFVSERAWCEKAGVAATYIGSLRSRHATGEARTAKIEQVRKLADAAEVTVDWLMNMGPPETPRVTIETNFGQPPDDIAQAVARSALDLAILDAETAGTVITQLAGERFKSTVPLPPDYWRERLKRLIAEAEGRAKDVHHRSPAEVADLTEESPEVRRARKKPKRL